MTLDASKRTGCNLFIRTVGKDGLFSQRVLSWYDVILVSIRENMPKNETKTKKIRIRN